MNHRRVRVNRRQTKHSGSLLSPDAVQLTAAGLKAKQDRTGCCEEAVRRGQSFMALHGGDVAWSGVAIDKLQRAESIDCKLFVVGWLEIG